MDTDDSASSSSCVKAVINVHKPVTVQTTANLHQIRQQFLTSHHHVCVQCNKKSDNHNHHTQRKKLSLSEKKTTIDSLPDDRNMLLTYGQIHTITHINFFTTKISIEAVWLLTTTTTHTPQPFYSSFSGTTRVSRCQKRTSGLHGARGD